MTASAPTTIDFDNDGSARQHQASGVTVWRPHIDRDDFYSLPIGHAGEIVDDRRFVTVGQHVDDRVLAHVADDGARLFEQMNFVDAEPFGRLEFDLVAELLNVGGEHAAHRTLGHASLISDMGERALHGLPADPLDQAACHVAAVVNERQFLEMRFRAAAATIAPSVEIDTDAFAVRGQIANQPLVPTESNYGDRLTVRARGGNAGRLGIDVVVVLSLIYPEHRNAG